MTTRQEFAKRVAELIATEPEGTDFVLVYGRAQDEFLDIVAQVDTVPKEEGPEVAYEMLDTAAGLLEEQLGIDPTDKDDDDTDDEDEEIPNPLAFPPDRTPRH